MVTLGLWQGGMSRTCVGAALSERAGLLRKEGPPNILYFIAKCSIVAIYAIVEKSAEGFCCVFRKLA